MPASSPTILDSLIIELGLDSSKFRTGADDAERGARKARDETEKSAKDIQKAVGEGVSNAFQNATRRAMEFFAVLAGASTLEQFAVNVTGSATQLGIISRTLGMAPDRISAIGMAVQRAGGNADAAIQSLQRLKDMQTGVAISGQMPPLELQKLGVDVRSASSPEELLNRTVEAMQKSPRHLTQSQQIAILRGLGVDDATANFWVTRGSAGTRAAIVDAQKDATTPGQVAAATQLTAAWYEAQQAVQSVGREILSTVSPAIEALLKKVGELVEANKGAITGWFDDNVKSTVAWLTNPDTWSGAKKTIDDLKRNIDQIADATGGWGNLSKILVAIWAGNQIAPIISAVGLLTLAFTRLSASMLFATGGALGTALALFVGTQIPRFRHWMETPETDEDELRGARAKLKLSGNANPTDEDIRKMVQYDKQPWWGRILNTPDSFDESLRQHKTGPYAQAIATSEGPVSEGRPLPVKIVGDGSTPPSSAPSSSDNSSPAPSGSGGASAADNRNPVQKATDWLFGGNKTSTSPPGPAPFSPPAHPHTPTPGLWHAGGTSTGPIIPAPHHAATGHYHIHDPNKDPLTSHEYPAPGEQSYLGGSAVYAAGQAHRVASAQRGSSRVTIEAMNVHTAPASKTAREDFTSKHIKSDFWAMRSDVGLA
jgi:hypothetical protein